MRVNEPRENDEPRVLQPHRTAVRGVLFDVDGTLLDSNDAHAEAVVRAMAEAGFPADAEDVRRLIGKGADKLLPESIGIDADSGMGKHIAKRKDELFLREYLPRLRPTPGARALVAELKRRELRLVVATSAGADVLEPLLKQAGVADLFATAANNDDADDSKPDPDIVLAALRKSGCRAGEVVLIGDTPYDMTAARRAGVAALGLRCGGWTDRALRGALAVYDHPADLHARLEQSVLARGLPPSEPAEHERWD